MDEGRHQANRSLVRGLRKGLAGNAPTLRYADERSAYTVMDRATFLTLRNEIKLVVLVEKDEALLNYISLIPVNPKKFPRSITRDDGICQVAHIP